VKTPKGARPAPETVASLEVANRFRLAALTFRAIGAFALASAYDQLVERELAGVVDDEGRERNGAS
jgi:hypothetical protein